MVTIPVPQSATAPGVSPWGNATAATNDNGTTGHNTTTNRTNDNGTAGHNTTTNHNTTTIVPPALVIPVPKPPPSRPVDRHLGVGLGSALGFAVVVVFLAVWHIVTSSRERRRRQLLQRRRARVAGIVGCKPNPVSKSESESESKETWQAKGKGRTGTTKHTEKKAPPRGTHAQRDLPTRPASQPDRPPLPTAAAVAAESSSSGAGAGAAFDPASLPHYGTPAWLHAASLGAAVLAPVGLALPPRGMSMRTVLLAAGAFFATSQLAYDYTGRSLYQRAGAAAAGRRAWAEQQQQQQAAKPSGEPADRAATPTQPPPASTSSREWVRERARREKEVLESGGGYWDLITEQIGEVWADLRGKGAPGGGQPEKQDKQDKPDTK
ncbi:hypothetical protein SPI_05565 [Niveomyces insectorum RCEF 264]|uniref:Uncharacterized protein n=1 Tax=Niveomyces insectorum RCEF 264 TaxID=1081102 RepID=A0A167TC31_9HYPO|nr:hypothetical protein SPI_05565 [Niveomyces insectorum RCEF 264]